jgi:hypothetical protein
VNNNPNGKSRLNPFDYLKDLFTRLPAAKVTQIREFTPTAGPKRRRKWSLSQHDSAYKGCWSVRDLESDTKQFK